MRTLKQKDNKRLRIEEFVHFPVQTFQTGISLTKRKVVRNRVSLSARVEYRQLLHIFSFPCNWILQQSVSTVLKNIPSFPLFCKHSFAFLMFMFIRPRKLGYVFGCHTTELPTEVEEIILFLKINNNGALSV